MAIGVSNIRTVTKVSGASTTLAYSGAVTAGSTLVSGGSDYNLGVPASPAVSDSVNGSWTVNRYAGMTADTHIEVFLASFPNTGAGTPTVTWDPANSADMGALFIAEVTGAANPSIDVVPAASQQTGTTPSIASGTLAQANEVIFAVLNGATFNGVVTIAADGTYTEIVNQPDNASSQMGHAQYKIVATTTTDTADWTITDAGGSAKEKVSILISIKEAAGSGATPSYLKRRSLLGVGR